MIEVFIFFFFLNRTSLNSGLVLFSVLFVLKSPDAGCGPVLFPNLLTQAAGKSGDDRLCLSIAAFNLTKEPIFRENDSEREKNRAMVKTTLTEWSCYDTQMVSTRALHLENIQQSAPVWIGMRVKSNRTGRTGFKLKIIWTVNTPPKRNKLKVHCVKRSRISILKKIKIN